MTVYSPGQCWDDKSLGMGMGGSSPANITGEHPCHGWVIPRIVLGLSVGADGSAGICRAMSVPVRPGALPARPGISTMSSVGDRELWAR
jgi:hypothetical protein